MTCFGYPHTFCLVPFLRVTGGLLYLLIGVTQWRQCHVVCLCFEALTCSSVFTMAEAKEQCATWNSVFCWEKLQLEPLSCFKQPTMSLPWVRSVYEWFSQFKNEELQNELSCSKICVSIPLKRSETGINACHELKEQLEVNPDLFAKVFTGEKTWSYDYNPEMKQQSSLWKHLISPHKIQNPMNKQRHTTWQYIVTGRPQSVYRCLGVSFRYSWQQTPELQ